MMLKEQFEKFLDVLTKFYFNLLFIDAIMRISSYARLLKDMILKKRKLLDFEEVVLRKESSVRLQNKLPRELKVPRSFNLPISLGKEFFLVFYMI